VNVLAECKVMWEYRALPDQDAAAIVTRAMMHAQSAILHATAPAARGAIRDPRQSRLSGLARDMNSPAVKLACAYWAAMTFMPFLRHRSGLFQGAGIPP